MRSAIPISGEIGKSIIFAVSQNHAAKLTQILNQMADRMFPGKYQSDFAVQVTSQIPDAQQFTINFTNNNLLGSANFLPRLQDQQGPRLRHRRHDDHRLRLPRHPQSRPVPPDLLPHRFHPDQRPRHAQAQLPRTTIRRSAQGGVKEPQKTAFKLFDFFANCEYFEEEYNYDEVIKLPQPKGTRR